MGNDKYIAIMYQKMLRSCLTLGNHAVLVSEHNDENQAIWVSRRDLKVNYSEVHSSQMHTQLEVSNFLCQLFLTIHSNHYKIYLGTCN